MRRALRGRGYGDVVGRHLGDETRRVDLVAEEALERAMARRRITARVVSEERGDRVVGGGEPGGCFIFDPVDGSTNIARDIPLYTTSLAWSPKTRGTTLGDITRGAVVSIPDGHTYEARRGEGARLNGRLLRHRVPPGRSVVGLYAYGAGRPAPGVQNLLAAGNVRTLGSMALDLCLTARGSLDGVADVRGILRGFDVAAGLLILRETGGVATDLRGNPLEGKPVGVRGFTLVAAGRGEKHRELLEVLG
ncbi:MAG: inositol-1-monophosphatase [Euryarchaeota archaeon]|nr:inositol-1-monophosphatase [Euryarchaeota archaeon]